MKRLKIVLIGYGKMGHALEQIAQQRGHEVVLTIDRGDEDRFDDLRFLTADVAIEFTSPQTAYANCLRALERGLPTVSGTTGWSEELPKLRKLCKETGKTFFWASNFSIGVHLFLQINRRVAELMKAAPSYQLSLEETHHIHKLDAPSGTAITLAEVILDERHELKRWELTEVDRISLTHEAFGRQGFALGAVLAAEYATQHSGWLTMEDLLGTH